jgi:hypothetical protein
MSEKLTNELNDDALLDVTGGVMIDRTSKTRFSSAASTASEASTASVAQVANVATASVDTANLRTAVHIE